MKKPKSCYGCKAFYQSQWQYTCELGYQIKRTKVGSYKGADIIRPSPECGECPKPLTLKEFFDAKPKAR
jgi:hypothetical protein